jgi:hypothetical protein
LHLRAASGKQDVNPVAAASNPEGGRTMFRKMTFALLLTLSFAAFAAMAEQTYVNIEQRLTAEQLHATGLDTLSPAQLEQLNQVLRGESAKVAASEKPRVEDEQEHGSLLGLDVEPIHSRLKGSVSSWEPGTVFELENGQKWKVLKGNMKLRKAMDAPDILVIPGIAGRWFLQVDEDLPKARVYRID